MSFFDRTGIARETVNDAPKIVESEDKRGQVVSFVEIIDSHDITFFQAERLAAVDKHLHIFPGG